MACRLRQIAIVPAAAVFLAACQSSNPPAPKPASGGNFLANPSSPDAIVNTDPAAMRLQDIGGYLLLYFHQHQQMPPSLDDLRAIPGGDQLNFTSPSTGEPFAYYSAGIWEPDKQDRCIVAYDPARVPGGTRWCLFMYPPKGSGSLSANVVALPEPIFLSYRPAQQ